MTTERDRERERMAAELRRGSIPVGAGERGTVSGADHARIEKPVGMSENEQGMRSSGEGMMRGGAPLREGMPGIAGGALPTGGFPSTAAGEGGGTAVRKPRAVTEDTIRRAFEIYQEYDKGFREFVERCKQNETIYRQQFEFLKKGNARADGEGRENHPRGERAERAAVRLPFRQFGRGGHAQTACDKRGHEQNGLEHAVEHAETRHRFRG